MEDGNLYATLAILYCSIGGDSLLSKPLELILVISSENLEKFDKKSVVRVTLKIKKHKNIKCAMLARER